MAEENEESQTEDDKQQCEENRQVTLMLKEGLLLHEFRLFLLNVVDGSQFLGRVSAFPDYG